MKVTFLGTSGAVPSARHNNVCFVAHAAEPVLFECGPSILYQLAVASIDHRAIRTVIISHVHGDHSLGLPMLLMAGRVAKRTLPLTVCLPASAIEPMRRVCTTVYPGLRRVVASEIQWIPLPDKGPGALNLPGQIRAATTPAAHSVPVVSTHARFEREGVSLAFSGDTARCEAVGLNALDADLLVHESNWSVTLGTETGHGHSTAADAGEVAALAKPTRLALVHTSPELAGHEREIEAEAGAHFHGEVLAPADFSTIEI